jgi:hypothetical protein
MNFLIHSKNSVKKYGGEQADYEKIHKFMDSFKVTLADSRHRLFLHNTGGIHAATIAFGDSIKNSAGKDVSVRDICTDHILEDLRTIPTVEEIVKHIDKSQYALMNTRVLGELIKYERKNVSG